MAPGSNNIQNVNFMLLLKIDIMSISWENCSHVIAMEPTDDVNVGSGNGLVPLGSKPLQEPILPQICVANWCH